MYSKTKVFNLSLSACLLSAQLIDADNDKSNNAKVLLLNWDVALSSTLADLDLDSTSSQADLELIEQNPNSLWQYSYKYPQKCAFLRRIQSLSVQDNGSSFIPRRVATKEGQRVIFTNQENAIAEFIPSDVSLDSLNPAAIMALSFRLASLAAPLITGKGAKSLIQQIDQKYIVAKAEAQRIDRLENFSVDDPSTESEFVEARTT